MLAVYETQQTGMIVPVDVTEAHVLIIDDNPVDREILLEQRKARASTVLPLKVAP